MNKLYLGDWLNNDIPDKSVNLIIADPPYFEVKGDFDFIWPSFEAYLQDVEKWAVECKRVLADNGSLLWWGHARKIAYSQVIFDKYFRLENHIIWEKDIFWGLEYREHSRAFAPITEHLLFYSNEIVNINGLCVNNARDYIRGEIIKSKGKTLLKEINRALGTASNGGGVASAVLSLEKAEPSMITKEHYLKLRTWLNDGKEIIYLSKEYADLRRPFDNVYQLTDVIKHSQEAQITSQYDHETIKPLTLTKKLIQTTTRKGDLVLIPFGGSGTDVEACINTDREYICYEIDSNHYQTIKNREKFALMQGELF